jgi:hypothetical protein
MAELPSFMAIFSIDSCWHTVIIEDFELPAAKLPLEVKNSHRHEVVVGQLTLMTQTCPWFFS